MLDVAAQAATKVFEVAWFFGSFLAYGLGVGLMAFYARRAAIGPGWLNWLGMIAGVTGLIWLRFFIPALQPLELLGSLLNILLIFIWSIGLSVVLVRRGEA